jgi:biotin carboxylase
VAERAVLFVNLRGVPAEDRSALVAARRLGYAVDLLAPALPPHAAGLVRDFQAVDTGDYDAALAAAVELAGRGGPAGVLTWGDLGVELTARIADRLGLPGLSPAAARRARHKVEMKAAAAPTGLVGRNARVTGPADLPPALAAVGFPAVLKPAAAAGSFGIFEVRDAAQARAAYDRLAALLPDVPAPWRGGGAGELILDEYLDGPEFSVEGWVAGGAVTIAAVTDKTTTDPYHLEVRHVLPAALPGADEAAVRAGAEQVVRALGLDHCAFHLECKLTPRGVRLIEVAGRPGGDYIASHLVPLATGIDLHAACVRIACGQRPPEPEPGRLYAGVRFVLADRPGRLAGVDGLAEALALSRVEQVFPELPPGAPVRLPPADFESQRVAAVLARAPSHAEVVETLEAAAALVSPRIVPD